MAHGEATGRAIPSSSITTALLSRHGDARPEVRCPRLHRRNRTEEPINAGSTVLGIASVGQQQSRPDHLVEVEPADAAPGPSSMSESWLACFLIVGKERWAEVFSESDQGDDALARRLMARKSSLHATQIAPRTPRSEVAGRDRTTFGD